MTKKKVKRICGWSLLIILFAAHNGLIGYTVEHNMHGAWIGFCGTFIILAAGGAIVYLLNWLFEL